MKATPRGSRARREIVGGVRGYADLLEAVEDPTHPEHDETPEWIGGGSDPERVTGSLARKRR